MAHPPLPDIGSRQPRAVLAVAEYRDFIAAAVAREVRLDHAVVVSQIPTMMNLARANVGAGRVPRTGGKRLAFQFILILELFLISLVHWHQLE